MEAFLGSARNHAASLNGHGQATSKEFFDNFSKYADSFSRLSWATLEAALAQLGDRGLTLGALVILAAKTKHSDFSNNIDLFIAHFTAYMENADASQIQSYPVLFVEICQNITALFIRRKTALLGINLMTKAIRVLQVNPRQLTSIHTSLLELCLASTALKTALPYIIDDIDDFSVELKGMECKAILAYFYYGGMILTGLKKYSQAIYFFEASIRVPAMTLSHIMLESYKKYILLSLIQYGEIPQPPKCSVQLISRVLRPSATNYHDIATSFGTHNPSELNNVINRHQEVFRRDNNFGLVKQVKSAQTKLNIKRLTKTFLTLSLADVASRAQLQGGAQQAEKYILSMIQDGEIYAKINQKDGMVVFLDNKEKYDTPRMMQRIENQTLVCMDLNKRLTEMNEKLATNPDYISKVVQATEDEGISSSKLPSFNM